MPRPSNVTEQDELNAEVQDFPWLDADSTPAAGLKVKNPKVGEDKDPELLVALTIPVELGMDEQGPVDVMAHDYRGNLVELSPEDMVRARQVFGAYWVEAGVRYYPGCDEYEPEAGFSPNAAGVEVCEFCTEDE